MAGRRLTLDAWWGNYTETGHSTIVDVATRTALNDSLWENCPRVVELTQQRLEEFVWSAGVATWNE